MRSGLRKPPVGREVCILHFQRNTECRISPSMIGNVLHATRMYLTQKKKSATYYRAVCHAAQPMRFSSPCTRKAGAEVSSVAAQQKSVAGRRHARKKSP